jgi:hypothetical protein
MRFWLLFCLVSVAGFGQVLPLRFANVPACAGESAVPRPKADAEGNYLLLRIADPSSVAVEVWCKKEAAGYNYEYRLAGREGASRRLDRCQLPDGINAAGVEHEGTLSESKLENGGDSVKASGRLVKFIHNNWDTRSGHHVSYDFQRQLLTTYTSEAYRDAMGRWIHLLSSATANNLNGVPQSEPVAALGKLPPERKFDPQRVSCVSALADEGHGLRLEEVNAYTEPGKLGKAVVAWPENNLIERIQFEPARRELRVKFAPGARKSRVSMAFPRDFLGLGKEVTKVRLDGVFVPIEETITSTHKVVRFTLQEPVKEALLTESGGFPFFMVSGIALVGGLVIGTVVALLFRRVLPAVAEN